MAFEEVINSCERTVVWWSPWHSPESLRRVWCLYEILSTLKKLAGWEQGEDVIELQDIHTNQKLVLGISAIDLIEMHKPENAAQLLLAIDSIRTMQAQATVDSDWYRIHCQIEEALHPDGAGGKFIPSEEEWEPGCGRLGEYGPDIHFADFDDGESRGVCFGTSAGHVALDRALQSALRDVLRGAGIPIRDAPISAYLPCVHTDCVAGLTDVNNQVVCVSFDGTSSLFSPNENSVVNTGRNMPDWRQALPAIGSGCSSELRFGFNENLCPNSADSADSAVSGVYRLMPLLGSKGQTETTAEPAQEPVCEDPLLLCAMMSGTASQPAQKFTSVAGMKGEGSVADLVVGGQSKSLVVWTVDGASVQHIATQDVVRTRVCAVAIAESDSQALVFVGDHDGFISVFDFVITNVHGQTEAQQQPFKLLCSYISPSSSPILSINLDESDDQLCAVGNGNGDLELWQWYEGLDGGSSLTLLRTLDGHTDAVRAVAWLSNGRCISCSDDKTIRVWTQQAAGEKAGKDFDVTILSGHFDRVTALALCPTCTSSTHKRPTLFVSASADATIRLWDATTLVCVGICAHVSPLTAVTCFLDWSTGRMISCVLVGDEHGCLEYWDLDDLIHETPTMQENENSKLSEQKTPTT